MDKQIIHDFRIGKVNKDNNKEYRCDKLIELNKYKFYLVDTDLSYSYSVDVNIRDNVIYLCKNYYYYYENAELAECDITFLMKKNTFKSIMKDIKYNNDDFIKNQYAITFRIKDRILFFLKGSFENADNSKKENILIKYEIKEVKGLKSGLKVKNVFKSGIESIFLDKKHKTMRTFTPDDFDEKENEV